MARRKRTARPSGDPSKPNTILVILLVLFFLSTAGLGGWVYSMFNDRLKYEEAAKKADKEKNRLEQDLTFAQGTTYAFRAVMGDPLLQKEDAEEYKTFKDFLQNLEDRYKPVVEKEKGGQDAAQAVELNKDEQQVKSLMELILASQEDLPWNKDTYIYEKKYPEVIAKLKEDLKKAQIEGKGFLPDKLATEEQYRSLDAKQKGDRKNEFADIKKGNDAALADAQKYLVEMKEQIAKNDELRNEMKKQGDLADLEKKRLVAQNTELKAKLELQGVMVGDAGAPPPPLTKKDELKAGGSLNYAGTPHALMLDISRGKPLWDMPRAKIVRVDDKAQRVHLDKGAENGIRTQMTFNVFGAGWDNRAEKMLKGTVEVIRVDAKSSEARITSLYDSEGREIALGDQGTGKLLREASNPIKEGDLLFNLAWGSHVAIAGVIDWNGQGSDTEAGLVEDLEQFRNLLKAQGVIVDAFIDMRDGKIYGNMTPRTNYLIRGYGFAGLTKKELTPRIAAINDNIAVMQRKPWNAACS